MNEMALSKPAKLSLSDDDFQDKNFGKTMKIIMSNKTLASMLLDEFAEKRPYLDVNPTVKRILSTEVHKVILKHLPKVIDRLLTSSFKSIDHHPVAAESDESIEEENEVFSTSDDDRSMKALKKKKKDMIDEDSASVSDDAKGTKKFCLINSASCDHLKENFQQFSKFLLPSHDSHDRSRANLRLLWNLS